LLLLLVLFPHAHSRSHVRHVCYHFKRGALRVCVLLGDEGDDDGQARLSVAAIVAAVAGGRERTSGPGSPRLALDQSVGVKTEQRKAAVNGL
jgi:hypothetical protein